VGVDVRGWGRWGGGREERKGMILLFGVVVAVVAVGK
jgi:hypothetical protein